MPSLAFVFCPDVQNEQCLAGCQSSVAKTNAFESLASRSHAFAVSTIVSVPGTFNRPSGSEVQSASIS